ncbi:MAG: response regulator [Trichloromonadaceae bacterium]
MTPPLRLLHLEENRCDAGLILALLREDDINCQVNLVSTLPAFIARLKTDQSFDLVFSDHSSSIDGLAALAASRALRPECPFVFIAATPGTETVAQALSQGATDFVHKSRLSRLAMAVQRARLPAQVPAPVPTAITAPLPVSAGAGAPRLLNVSPAGGTETILVAEDDHLVRTLLSSVLNRFGYRVIEAADGQEALALFLQYRQEIALVVLDRVMPKKSGDEVLLELRAHRPDLPALFISGYPEALQIVIEAGPGACTGFLAKPFAPDHLMESIRELLEPALWSGQRASA